MLRPGTLIPIHFNTSNLIEQDPNAWAAAGGKGDRGQGACIETGRELSSFN